MRRRGEYIVWVVIAATVAVLLLIWQYRGYRLSTRALPSGTTLADLSVGGMTQAQVLNALDVAFATPLTVSYLERQLSVPPSLVGLQYDGEQTARNLEAALAGWRGVDGFIAYVVRQQPDRITAPVAVTYSEELLARFLDRVANQCDSSPQGPVPLSAALDFRKGQPGSMLNAEASRARVAEVLASAVRHEVDLVVQVEQPPPRHLSLLGELVEAKLSRHPGLIPGVFVKDLQTGDELVINGGVAFAGLSVLKVAVVEEAYRALAEPPGMAVRELISETMTESDNASANHLLRDVVGRGDIHAAVDRLTSSMNQLGLVNTYMAAPYDEKDTTLEVVTPANARTDISTDPDPFIQTTPLDVGLLLEMIYHCNRGGGSLLLTYPGQLTPEECADMIGWMSENRINSLIEAGVPPGTVVAHKHGWTTDTHADVGLVFTPGGDYVLVIFLHRADWLGWDESASVIADISRAAYNYFNPEL